MRLEIGVSMPKQQVIRGIGFADSHRYSHHQGEYGILLEELPYNMIKVRFADGPNYTPVIEYWNRNRFCKA